MKTKILVDFQICISVPLRGREKKIKNKSEQDQIKPNIQISQFKQFHGLSDLSCFSGVTDQILGERYIASVPYFLELGSRTSKCIEVSYIISNAWVLIKDTDHYTWR